MTIQDLEYIQHLERELKSYKAEVCVTQKALESARQELAAVKRERDAAVSDMKRAQGCICNICKNHYRPDPAVRRYECKILGKFSDIFDDDDGGALFCGKFEWQGVCSDTEAQSDGGCKTD